MDFGSTTRRRATIAGIAALLLVFLPFASLPAGAQDESAQDESTQGNEVSSFTLDNGLEVVVIPDHRAPVVTHMLWYKVGSADEEPGKSGLAHYLEHLLFAKTRSYPEGEFSERVAAVGGRENAFTSYDYTAYYQQVTPDELGTMMRYEADRMRNLDLSEERFEAERAIIVEERGSQIDNSPDSLLSEEVNATLYQNHPYKRPVIGWMHEIRTHKREYAMAFYDRYYWPNNAILVVAGDVDAQEVRDLAIQTYGQVPRGPETGPRLRPSEPEQDTDRTVTLVDPRVSVPSVSQRWVAPSYRTAEAGEAEALDLLAEILGGGTRSRLYQSLVVDKGIASSTGAFYQGTYYDPAGIGVYGAPRGEATLEEVETAMRAEIARIKEEGVSEDELERAKNRFVRSMIFARDDQSSMARIYGAALATGSTVEDVQEWPERIRAVTVEDVKSVATRYLADDGSVTGYLLPDESDRT